MADARENVKFVMINFKLLVLCQLLGRTSAMPKQPLCTTDVVKSVPKSFVIGLSPAKPECN